ncbi:PadR family transcriptional regulator [Parvibaculum sp.]|uniref:PadR family transcriptional regulator n=1 Tax=Parvibaculum sp. TaxID=2024848 RepID=UPI0025F6E98A|nr:PadR family transcriptional regulator [Parvibaculum sp.]
MRNRKMFGHAHRHRHGRGPGDGFEGFEEMGGGRGWGRRHRRRRGRIFEQGDLRFLILGLIAEKLRHGYEIIKAIEEETGGAYTPSPGVIYPTLTLLEEMGQIAATEGDGNRKQFAITAEGEAYLAENRSAAEAVKARMREVASEQADRPAPEIQRAIENLRNVLYMRGERGPIDRDEAKRIAETLDRAARDIENG